VKEYKGLSEAAASASFVQPELRDHVLVVSGGRGTPFPDGVEFLLATLRSADLSVEERATPVLVLSEQPPSDDQRKAMAPFASGAHFMIGNSHVAVDLLRAGLREARQVILLSGGGCSSANGRHEHRADNQEAKLLADADVIVLQHTIQALLHDDDASLADRGRTAR